MSITLALFSFAESLEAGKARRSTLEHALAASILAKEQEGRKKE